MARRISTFDFGLPVRGVLTAAFVTAAMPAQADLLLSVRYAADPGAAERLEAADRLRTLSHEVASAACHMAGGVEPDQSRKLMIETKRDVIRISAALRHGDAGWNILGEETDRAILADLDKFDATWAPVQAALETLMESPQDADALRIVKAASEELFETSYHLLSVLSGEYSNPMDLLQSDAILMDIVGRQAMLTQKIAKEACEVWTGTHTPERVDALYASTDMFELGIRALHDGMPELGIKPAPTPGIRYALEDVLSDWEIVRGHLALVKAGEIGEADKSDLYTRLNDKMYKLEKLVHMYVEFSKHDYGVNGG
ncbi:type IV pili methyl-accepting chemotaxis transducer N-terminal domain-containing protein [Jannaschia aquimarina]|uniref:NarX-like N-terminal domain-containing protein n=1 Tax=Jannaschia aquimarina TaxID=935700 RepID=A0A0D1CM02_9RHOB|nr:type IV pili methyl-accepting chemotaxis transducer N-terminal domain-containing protein [Jannaschia aquimarina]KIT15787.1 hypothetical protein jaqu_24650 [Jannaschia aquimarina]SNT21061.1 Type IV pili methyl-accepting chemotaxis transducer N-term [Jannaschia aquimarina]